MLELGNTVRSDTYQAVSRGPNFGAWIFQRLWGYGTALLLWQTPFLSGEGLSWKDTAAICLFHSAKQAVKLFNSAAWLLIHLRLAPLGPALLQTNLRVRTRWLSVGRTGGCRNSGEKCLMGGKLFVYLFHILDSKWQFHSLTNSYIHQFNNFTKNLSRNLNSQPSYSTMCKLQKPKNVISWLHLVGLVDWFIFLGEGNSWQVHQNITS